MNQINIGFGARARVGKDYICNHIIKQIAREYQGIVIHRYSFAGALKNELDDLLTDKFKISAWTAHDHEKELIRPMLVSYGNIWRQIDQDHWVKIVHRSMCDNNIIDGKLPVVNFVTDVRFANEAKWIKTLPNHNLICISAPVEPINDCERDNHLIVDGMSDTLVYNDLQSDEVTDKCWELVKNMISDCLTGYKEL